MHHWLNSTPTTSPQITWYPEEHEFIVKWTTGVSITVSEEQGVRALEEIVHREPHDLPPGPGVHLTDHAQPRMRSGVVELVLLRSSAA